MKIASKVLGPAGAALEWLQTADHLFQGEYWQAGDAGVGAALGTAALLTVAVPPISIGLGIASAAWTVGTMLSGDLPLTKAITDSAVNSARATRAGVDEAVRPTRDSGRRAALAANDIADTVLAGPRHLFGW